MCSASPKHTVDLKSLLKLWYHENMRVFHDRLTTGEDRTYLKDMLALFFKDFGFEAI
jgi:dynein heavy chain